MEQPLIRLQKNAEKTTNKMSIPQKIRLKKNAEKKTNKMRIPQQIIDKCGNKFYMEIYKDCIKLIPIKKGE